MRVAVTGAGGLTGGEIARLLSEQGHDVIGIVRSSRATPNWASRVADCADPAALARCLAGADVLIHVAGISLGEPVSRAAREAGVARIIAISSAGVYSRHRASAVMYRYGESAITTLHGDALIIRPTMIYGSERDRNVHHVIGFAGRWGFLPVVGAGSARIQPIHYADLAAAITELSVADSSGTVDAGGGAPITLRDAAIAIFAGLQRPPHLVHVPLSLGRLLATARGQRWLERVDRMTEDRTVDNTRLLQMTQVRPRDFPAGVRDQLGANK